MSCASSSSTVREPMAAMLSAMTRHPGVETSAPLRNAASEGKVSISKRGRRAKESDSRTSSSSTTQTRPVRSGAAAPPEERGASKDSDMLGEK